MRRFKVFLWNGLLLTLTSLLMRSVGFSFGIYISKKVGAEALGVFQLILSVYMFAITLATSGINLATTRIVVEETTFNPNHSTKKAMRKCLGYSLLFGCCAGVLLALLAKPISISLLHGKVPYSLFYIISISLPCIAMSSTLNGYFTALRKNGRNAINRIFEQCIKIGSTAYFLSLFMPSGLEYACLCLVLGEAISEILSFLLAAFLYYFERKKYTDESDTNKNYLSSVLKISLPVAITSYLRSGLSSLKQLLIPLRLEKSGMSCDSAIANYGLINGMTMPIIMFPEVIINSFSGLLVPEFTYYDTKKDFSKITYLISKIFRITLLFSIGVIGVFLFYSNNISMAIYQNLEIAPYLKIISPLIFFMYLDSIVDNILKGLDKQMEVMGCNILDLFVSIFCIFFLLPIFGIYGYLFVIFVSELLNSGISILQLKQATHFKIDIKNWILKPCFGILLSHFLCCLFIRNTSMDIFSTILQIIIFLGFYLAFLLLSNAFQIHER